MLEDCNNSERGKSGCSTEEGVGRKGGCCLVVEMGRRDVYREGGRGGGGGNEVF